jgi:hypothetical protein
MEFKLKQNDIFYATNLKERAMLILTNAYNAYLHHTTDPNTEGKQDNLHALHQYRYGQHEEEGIKVSEGGYPPYEISMFVLNDGNIATLPQDIELASSIVRSNRRDGRVADRWNLSDGSNDFAKAPVPIVIQEIVRDERLTKDDWNELKKIDWNDIYTLPWDSMTDGQFDTYLEKKGKLTQSLANAIKKIRRKLIALYDPEVATSAHLIEQYKTIIGIVCDHERRTHIVIPFVKLGLDK